MKRKVAFIGRLKEEKSSFAAGPAVKLVSFMWELTKEVWFLRDPKHAKQRLQRNVAKLIRQ